MAKLASSILHAGLGASTTGFQSDGITIESPALFDDRARSISHSRSHCPYDISFDHNSLLTVPAARPTLHKTVFGFPSLGSPLTLCSGSHSLILEHHHCISCHLCGLNILCCALQIFSC